MTKLRILAALAAFPCLAGSLPFAITTEDATAQFSAAPRIQSFTFAQWKGRWVFIGGRTAGYHAVGGAQAEFLRAHANREVWVVDTTVQPPKVYSAPLDGLPESMMEIRDQWASTAKLSYQDGDTLYIAGGYGQNHKGDWLTYPILSKANLSQLVEGVMRGRIPASSIRYAKSPLVQSTGGKLAKLPDGNFYLVMGHNFAGSYTAFQGQEEKNRPAVWQEYLNEIRKLTITAASDGTPVVKLVETFRDEEQFHRRDLNVVPYRSPKGIGLAVYGGVFTAEQLGLPQPVYLAAGERPSVRT